MLLYYNKSSFWLLLQLHGSVFYRCDTIIGSLLIALLGILTQYLRDIESEWAPSVLHHYGFQALGAGVTFAIVFRTQLALEQVLGGCYPASQHVQQMDGYFYAVPGFRRGLALSRGEQGRRQEGRRPPTEAEKAED